MRRRRSPQTSRRPVRKLSTNRSYFRCPLSSRALRKAQKKRKRSSLELTVYKWLEEEGIQFTKEKAIGRCHVDICIEEVKLAIEAQGCWYHACRKCYPDKADGKLIRRRDKRRFKFLRSRGYRVLEVLEHDVKLRPKATKQLIIDIIKKYRNE